MAILWRLQSLPLERGNALRPYPCSQLMGPQQSQCPLSSGKGYAHVLVLSLIMARIYVLDAHISYEKNAGLLRTFKERIYISTRHIRDIQHIVTLLLWKITLLWDRSWLPFLCCMCCPCNKQPFPHPAQYLRSTSYCLWPCSTSAILMSQWHHDSPMHQSQKLRVTWHPIWILLCLFFNIAVK